nr:MAG TPA: hypothetical protein [Caudoviricetes sp.]
MPKLRKKPVCERNFHKSITKSYLKLLFACYNGSIKIYKRRPKGRRFFIVRS